MALYVQLIYENGSRSPVTEVAPSADYGPVQVTIPSIDNGVVVATEITDEDGVTVAYTVVDMFLRVTDALQVTVIPPTDGWPAAACFSKHVDEAEVVAMRQRLQEMATHLREQQLVLIKEPNSNNWVKRGYKNEPTGDYL